MGKPSYEMDAGPRLHEGGKSENSAVCGIANFGASGFRTMMPTFWAELRLLPRRQSSPTQKTVQKANL
jgi:hypothetical protein